MFFDTDGLVAYTAIVVTKSYEVAVQNYHVNLQAAENSKLNGKLLQELVETNKEILNYLKGDK